MNTMLKVTPEKLIEAAGDFQNTEANVRSLTEEMISIVDSLKPVWQGEAATGFASLRIPATNLYFSSIK